MDPTSVIPRNVLIKMPEKENLKISKIKVTYKGVPTRLSAEFSKERDAGKKGLARSVQSDEKQGPISNITLSSKALI